MFLGSKKCPCLTLAALKNFKQMKKKQNKENEKETECMVIISARIFYLGFQSAVSPERLLL